MRKGLPHPLKGQKIVQRFESNGHSAVARLELRVEQLSAAVGILQELLGLPTCLPDVRSLADPRSRTNAEAMTERRRAAAILLAKEGALSMEVIASRIGFPIRSAPYVIGCDWFRRTSQGIELTPEGRQAAGA